ncbi:MAG: ABC transporter ATP-binding protein [Planctomycetales bacterium]|nr:ABC transporter ATP-binding protein [Planctomycetales bacterium]
MSSRDQRYVELFQVGKTYPNAVGDPFTVVEEFDLIMRRGDVVSLIGHSGCGKSTVLSMVAGLNETSRGSIAIGGREISGPGPDRAVVFQAPCLMPWLTAYQNVRLGVDRVYPHATSAERHEVCEYYLAAVGLGDCLYRLPSELSGGMQQRVGIARAIALKPRLLLLDEPFGRLDSITRMELQDVILRTLDRESITTLLVTHDVDEALYMSDRVCMMTSGPRARIGQLLELPFCKPRQREAVLEHPLYYDLRACLVSFLEEQDTQRGRLQEVEFVSRIQQEVETLVENEVVRSPSPQVANSTTELAVVN